MATPEQTKFLKALAKFIGAGEDLVAAWQQEDWNADVEAPLPPNLAPPMSLDEWFPELEAHYLNAFSLCVECAEPLGKDAYGDVECHNPPCLYFNDSTGRGLGHVSANLLLFPENRVL